MIVECWAIYWTTSKLRSKVVYRSLPSILSNLQHASLSQSDQYYWNLDSFHWATFDHQEWRTKTCTNLILAGTSSLEQYLQYFKFERFELLHHQCSSSFIWNNKKSIFSNTHQYNLVSTRKTHICKFNLEVNVVQIKIRKTTVLSTIN